MTTTDPRIRLIPEQLGDIRAWRVVCRDCGYLTMPIAQPRAEMIRRVHRHRHLVGRVGMLE